MAEKETKTQGPAQAPSEFREDARQVSKGKYSEAAQGPRTGFETSTSTGLGEASEEEAAKTAAPKQPVDSEGAGK